MSVGLLSSELILSLDLRLGELTLNLSLRLGVRSAKEVLSEATVLIVLPGRVSSCCPFGSVGRRSSCRGAFSDSVQF